jgi:hypothetical protein
VEAIGEAAEAVGEAVGAAAEAVGEAVGAAAEAVGEAVGEALAPLANLGNDVTGRRFKIVDNLIKYIKNNPVENHMNEIKISTPNKSFQVTEKGRKFYDKYDELFDILWFFSVDLDIWNLDDPGDLLVASEFSVYIREDIIKDKEINNLEDVIKKADNYGFDLDQIQDQLKSFLSLGLITPFNL